MPTPNFVAAAFREYILTSLRMYLMLASQGPFPEEQLKRLVRQYFEPYLPFEKYFFMPAEIRAEIGRKAPERLIRRRCSIQLSHLDEILCNPACRRPLSSMIFIPTRSSSTYR